jgi:hypothetical protein
VSAILINSDQANQILDEIREGRGSTYTKDCIEQCLNVTGDIRVFKAVGSAGMDQTLQDEDWRSRVRSRAIMVAASLR